jgi:hypothetical protein
VLSFVLLTPQVLSVNLIYFFKARLLIHVSGKVYI